MTRRPILLLVLAAVLVIGAGGCAVSKPGPAAAPPPPTAAAPTPSPPALKVVTSTNVYSAIAAAVGGDRVVAVPVVIDPNAVPSDYEPSPGDATEVTAADVVISNGGGYDDFMNVLLGPAPNNKPARVNVWELSGLAAPGDTSFNEHIWYSLSSMRTLASQLATEFGRLDPSNGQQYVNNAQAFAGKVGDLLLRANDIEAKHAGARVVVSDPVPDYLIEECGLADVTPQQFDGGDDPPNQAAIAQTVALFRGNAVRALIMNPQARGAGTVALEQAAGQARVPVVRMTETMPPGTTDYISWMKSQLDELSAALDRS